MRKGRKRGRVAEIGKNFVRFSNNNIWKIIRENDRRKKGRESRIENEKERVRGNAC